MQTTEIEIEATATLIWEALTSQDALRDWFNATTELEPRAGGQIRFDETRGEQVFRFEGSVDELTPSERISFNLRTADGGEARFGFRLRPGGDFTTVELQHEGFDTTSDSDRSFWNGDELIALREYITGIGPTH